MGLLGFVDLVAGWAISRLIPGVAKANSAVTVSSRLDLTDCVVIKDHGAENISCLVQT